MKRLFILTAILTLPVLFCASCEKYLDKSPDLGLDEKEIYKDFVSIRGYLDNCYARNPQWNFSGTNGANQHMNPMQVTDECVSNVQTNNNGGGSNFVCNQFNKGSWYKATRESDWEIGCTGATIINNSYKALRIANRVINDIDKVQFSEGAAGVEEKNQILGQAYFYRASFYYQLILRYGGMPKLDRVFTDQDKDLVRMTYKESSAWLISDLDKAISLLPDKWEDIHVGRPDKTAAMALKSRQLLYAASPLMQNGLKSTVKKDYDKALCLDAARASLAAISYLANTDTGRRFELTGRLSDQVKGPENSENMFCNNNDFESGSYRGIFLLEPQSFFHGEYLWYDRRKQDDNSAISNSLRRHWIWADLDSNVASDAGSMAGPTANVSTFYERKGPDGYYYPVFKNYFVPFEEREIEPKSGYQGMDSEGYYPWENMLDRDPRMYNNLCFPGERWGSKIGVGRYYITSWEGGNGRELQKQNPQAKFRDFSGWLCKKYIWPSASLVDPTYGNANAGGFGLHWIKNFYIRYAELYLNYAEALFEATGDPNYKDQEFTMSPLEAVNTVRARVGVTPVVPEYADAAHFRDTYRRERTVEFMFEAHRWDDIRRWMIFDELFAGAHPLYNVRWYCSKPGLATPTTDEEAAGLTFKYKFEVNTYEVRDYDTRNYWYPFCGVELGSLTNFTQNPGW